MAGVLMLRRVDSAEALKVKTGLHDIPHKNGEQPIRGRKVLVSAWEII